MKSLLLAVATVATWTFAPSAMAGTTAYVTAGLLSGGLEKCFQDAKKAAAKAGFTEAQKIAMDQDKKAGDFHADQKGSTLHMTFRCDPPSGVWSLAVSGIDNNETFKGYNDVVKAFD